MVTEAERTEIVQLFENANLSYKIILDRINRISKNIDLMDEAMVKPMKEKKRFFGLTLIAGGLPLDMVELKMRLEFTIKNLDKYITDFKNMKTTET